MITKQIAGLLYSFSYKLQDNEGNVWDIEATEKRAKGKHGFKIYSPETFRSKYILSDQIGSTYKMLAREMDLTKPIEGVGVPIIELAKIAYSEFISQETKFEVSDTMSAVDIVSPHHTDIWMCYSKTDEFCTLQGAVPNQLALFNWLYTHHFNLDLPEGTTTNLI